MASALTFNVEEAACLRESAQFAQWLLLKLALRRSRLSTIGTGSPLSQPAAGACGNMELQISSAPCAPGHR